MTTRQKYQVRANKFIQNNDSDSHLLVLPSPALAGVGDYYLDPSQPSYNQGWRAISNETDDWTIGEINEGHFLVAESKSNIQNLRGLRARQLPFSTADQIQNYVEGYRQAKVTSPDNHDEAIPLHTPLHRRFRAFDSYTSPNNILVLDASNGYLDIALKAIERGAFNPQTAILLAKQTTNEQPKPKRPKASAYPVEQAW